MNESLYKKVLNEMMNDPRIRSMQQYPQHGSCNTYQHSVYVAEDAYRIARFLHMRVRETELARGAMLHDSYLYNIRESGFSAWRHGTGHALVALENAEANYQLTDLEKDIIYSHMWPLNITHVPHYRESILVGTADKYTACRERIHQWREILTGVCGLLRSKSETGS